MLTLTEQEIAEITRKARPSAQARVLLEAGIPFRVIAGRPVVAREALLETLTGARHTSGPRLRLRRA